uniref:Uncharacterized protein n=1 Tax=Trichobilharzia regenti TaxID=157069 RepID=A0AA85JHC8_TRIRE|nr:unnamed protein product [Trichobilharzia regenti]
MVSVLLLFTKLFGLVLLKVISNILFFSTICFRKTRGELKTSLTGKTKLKGCDETSNSNKKIGVVIVSQFCFQRRGVEDKCSGGVSRFLKNYALFERVLGEVSVNVIVSWVNKLIQKGAFIARPQNTTFFLVYAKDSTDLCDLNKWFHILPNHQRTNKYFMSGQKKVKKEDRDDLADSSHILSLARRNFNHNNEWEDPRAYCSYSQLHSHIIPLSQRTPRCLNDNFSVKSKLLSKCRYITSESEDGSDLLKVGLQAAIKANLDYIIVINPRAINIHEDLLTKTMELLTDRGKNCQVDIVLGVTKRCSKITQSSVNNNSIKVNSFNGLYLLGLKGGHSLMSSVSLLCDNVTWSSMSAADRLWSNIYHKLPTWNSVCLRERLEEVSEPLDLLNVQQSIGLSCEDVLNDSISVIIPMGYGHPDDCIDPEDVELISSKTSKSLVNTIDLAIHNASGKRQIEIIIIDSSPAENNNSSNSPDASLLFTEPFRNVRLRPMINIHLHHYNPLETSVLKPNRGELIHYAADRYARGSMLVFVEPGVQLPVNWDSAVFYTLQRPGVGMGCFAYRLHLDDKYIHRKSLSWASNCWLASWIVNVQTKWSGVPLVGQPHFIYSHYLKCIDGYPRSCRSLHAIDLALISHQHLGDVVVTRGGTVSAGIPAIYAIRHGAYRTAVYTTLLGTARYLGATDTQLKWALESSTLSAVSCDNYQKNKVSHMPFVKPHYKDGY